MDIPDLLITHEPGFGCTGGIPNKKRSSGETARPIYELGM